MSGAEAGPMRPDGMMCVSAVCRLRRVSKSFRFGHVGKRAGRPRSIDRSTWIDRIGSKHARTQDSDTQAGRHTPCRTDGHTSLADFLLGDDEPFFFPLLIETSSRLGGRSKTIQNDQTRTVLTDQIVWTELPMTDCNLAHVLLFLMLPFHPGLNHQPCRRSGARACATVSEWIRTGLVLIALLFISPAHVSELSPSQVCYASGL